MAASPRMVTLLKGSATLRTASQALSLGVRGLSWGPLTNFSYRLAQVILQGLGSGCCPTWAMADLAPVGGGAVWEAPDAGQGLGLGVGLAAGVWGSGASGRRPGGPGHAQGGTNEMPAKAATTPTRRNRRPSRNVLLTLGTALIDPILPLRGSLISQDDVSSQR